MTELEGCIETLRMAAPASVIGDDLRFAADELERLQAEHNDLPTGERKIDYGLMWELKDCRNRLIVVKMAGEDRLRAFIGEMLEDTTEAAEANEK